MRSWPRSVLVAGVCAARPKVHRSTNLSRRVVRIKTFINPDGRTLPNLGREREGSGIVIDENGLVLTIGYLMVEANAAEVSTNDGRTVPAKSSDTTTKPASACCGRWSRSICRPLALRQVGRTQGARSGAGRELRRPRHGVAGRMSLSRARVRRKLGVSARGTRSSRARRIRPGAARR